MPPYLEKDYVVHQTKTNHQKHPPKDTIPTPTITTYDEKLMKILKTAKRRVGLKPMHPEHISATPITDDINDPKYSDIIKAAAREFLDKELKINTHLNILSTKKSQTSPILWIELEDSETADMLIRQSAKIRNPDGKAIMYHPKNSSPL